MDPNNIINGDPKYQAYPLYYPMSSPFKGNGGEENGNAGSRALMSADISNFPHTLFGIRISNSYDIPAFEDIAVYNENKKLDCQQKLTINISGTTLIADEVLQCQIVGGQNGQGETEHWHPFPVPFLLAGANMVKIDATRIASYFKINDLDIKPTCYATLVTGVFRNDERTTTAHRRRV